MQYVFHYYKHPYVETMINPQPPLQTACLAVMCSVLDDRVPKQLDAFECERGKIFLFHLIVLKNDSATLNYLLCKHMALNGFLGFSEFF